VRRGDRSAGGAAPSSLRGFAAATNRAGSRQRRRPPRAGRRPRPESLPRRRSGCATTRAS
jgi:hypothetical protein